jgi:Zn-dependent peptidase ImmA (M78 family)
LHRFIDPRTISRDQPALIDTREQLHFTAQWSELKWIEWQANQFASSLLLPRPVLQRALFQVQSDLGVSGPGYLEESLRVRAQILDRLSQRMNVSRTMLRIRLLHLDLLADVP